MGDGPTAPTGPFTGHRSPEGHHTTGKRAWSLHSNEWCYPHAPCAGCAVQMAEEDPCTCCDGTGVNRAVSDGA